MAGSTATHYRSCEFGAPEGPDNTRAGQTDTLWLFQSESHHLTFANWIVTVTQALALTHLSDGCSQLSLFLKSRCAPPLPGAGEGGSGMTPVFQGLWQTRAW